MKNSCARPPGPSIVSGVELLTVWDVDEHQSYDVRRGTMDERRHLIAIRTHAGMGRIQLTGGEGFDLDPGTFLVVENEKIARYYCASQRWAFWWFEHRIAGAPPYPRYDLVHAPVERDEPSLVSRIMSSLRRPHAAHRMHASAMFMELATRWTKERPATAGHPRHQATVQRTIDGMHHRLGVGWTVTEMAKFSGMSERLFRQVFLQATGRAPKQFYDGLRVDAATELLRLGTHSVKEVASRLGYSSPFHLSRVYRARVGVPPSSVVATEQFGMTARQRK